MAKAMAYVYADLIRKGAINPKTGKSYTVNDIPNIVKAEVEEILGQDA